MAEVFPPAGIDLGNPDWGLKQSVDANVQVSTLGDGYEFREPQGLNAFRKNLDPTWSNLDPDDAEAAYNFLEEKVKLTSVLWTHPVTGVVMKVIPDSLSLTYDTWGNAILSISWRQDFNPG